MADLADVEQAIADLVVATLYPSGPSQSSIIGSQCRVYRGWPVAAGLNSDLTNGILNITISPDEAPGRTTTRYLQTSESATNAPGMTLVVTANMLDFGGTPLEGDVVGALINGIPYVYRVLATDTVALVASGLAAAMNGSVAITLSGSTVRVDEPATIIARVVSDGRAALESRRQEKAIRVICWCPDPASRDVIAAAIDQKMARMPFLAASDGSSIRVTYSDTSVYDQAQNASLFRRDLSYLTEYATLSAQRLPSMLFGDVMISGGAKYG